MADAGDLYDEFGNYIGPELSESEEVRQSDLFGRVASSGHVQQHGCRVQFGACA